MLSESHKNAQLMKNLMALAALEKIAATPSALFCLLASEREPITRWVLIQRRFAKYRERVVLAWRVLRGDDIHEDCD